MRQEELDYALGSYVDNIKKLATDDAKGYAKAYADTYGLADKAVIDAIFRSHYAFLINQAIKMLVS